MQLDWPTAATIIAGLCTVGAAIAKFAPKTNGHYADKTEFAVLRSDVRNLSASFEAFKHEETKRWDRLEEKLELLNN